MEPDSVVPGAGQLAEDRLRSLWELHQRQFDSERELVNYAIEEAVRLTGSTMGFFHYFHPSEQQIELFTWSDDVRRTCTAPNPGMYDLGEAGNWADAARSGQPQVFNDYPHSPGRRGYPEGHSPIRRYLSVPVHDGRQVVLVAGVANKVAPYDDSDVQQLQLYLENVWRLLLRWRHEHWLADQNTRLEATIAERTAELQATVAALDAARAREARRREQLLALQSLQLQLSRLRNRDDLLRQAVAGGRAALGYDRLSIWLLEPDGVHIRGTWGTDEQGATRDERGARLELSPPSVMARVIAGGQRLMVVHDALLADHQGRQVGRGTSAVAPLWDGATALGCLAADNLLQAKPADDEEFEALHLYAAAVGHLLTRLDSEQALALGEQRLREAQRTAQLGSFEVDLRSGQCWWSPECFTLFGRDPSLGTPPADWITALLDPADRTAMEAAAAQSLQTAEAGELLVRLRLPDGQPRRHLVRVAGQPDASGHLARILGTAQDVTARYAAEEALLAEKERLAVTLRSIADGVIATDPEGRVVLLNRVAEELLGRDQDAVAGQPLATLVGADWLPASALDTDPPALVEDQLAGPDGRTRQITRCVTPIRRTGGPVQGAVVVIRDITLERRLQQELQVAAKLESLGVLAGGIAHDFNNLLATMVGNADLAREALTAGDLDEIRQSLRDIAAAGGHARGLTQQLLTFAQGSTPVRSTLALESLVRETAGFALRGSLCRAVVECAAGLPAVEADAAQVEQVLHNLLLNAAQAMPGGGTIAVELALASAAELAGLPLPAGAYVVLAVRDQGCGMSAAVLSRIFDPYFTTKPQGNGLGLASVYAIVRAHGGHITVTSTERHGSCFRVYLPATSAAPAVPSDALTGGARQPLRVLVLDDQDLVRRMLERLLAHDGHTVEAVADGVAAAAAWRAAQVAGRPYDVGIFDLTLPGGRSGQATLAAIQEFDPGARVVASSGYSTAPVMADYAAYGFCDRLVKPFHRDALLDVLSRIEPRS